MTITTAWYRRTDDQLFVFFGTLLYGILVFLLYQDVMKNKDTRGKEPLQNNDRLYRNYYTAIFLLLMFFLYIVFSLFACAYYSVKDMQLVRTYRPLNKKVKEMSSLQKKNYYDFKHAKTRMTLYGCGPWRAALKVWTLVSSVLAFFLYPYTKEKKQIALFIFLVILMTPMIIIFSMMIVFILSDVRPHTVSSF